MIKNIRLVMAAFALLCFCVPDAAFCEPMGNLQITLLPAAATSAGAKWRVVGETTWHSSGESVAYPIDNYVLEFASLVGWRTPQIRTITAPDSDTATTIATYQPMNTVVADSEAGFSGNQSSNGWYYGHWPNGTQTFRQYTTYGSNGTTMMWSGGYGTWCTLYSYGGHPELANETVRRWISTVNGPAVISGSVWKMPGTGHGNGIIGSIYIGGSQKYTKAIAWDNFAGTPYAFNANMTSGSAVDFAMNSNGDTDSDHCGYTSVIKVAVSTGSLRVNIQPSTAAGAKWRRAGTSTWFAGGETEYDLPVGTYTVELKDLAGWTKPAPQSVSVTDSQTCEAALTYPTGSLHVTIQPSGAIADGAHWRRVGTATWFASGDTESDVPIGSCSVEFSPIASLATPVTQTAAVATAQTCELTGTYVPGELLKVNILPALAVTHKGQWRRVGTTVWRNSGDSDRAPVGDCAIEFKKIHGWHEPLAVTSAIATGNPIEIIRTYRGGSVVAWGDSAYGGINVPSPNDDFVAIAAACNSSIGLRSDGTVATWGNYPDLPSPNSDFVAVSAGYGYYLGLKSDGSVAAWGLNNQGQCNVPAPNTGFVAIAGGEGGHAIGLRDDGTVLGWGDNYFGAANPQYFSSGVLAIATGISHSLALLPNGSITGWGDNNFGQLNIPSPNTDFVSIACGNYCSIGVKSDGSIAVWGANDYGQVSPLPSPNSGFVAASANRSVVGLKSDGSVTEWGYRVGSPSPNTGFVAVAAGENHSLALRIPDFCHICVTIQPAEAVAAGAKWRRVGTTRWLASGETEYDVPVGSSVEFSDLANWAKPATQAVTITANQTSEVLGTYLTLGSLKVNISPELAVKLGAQWRRVGTDTWLSSGASETLAVGSYNIEFKKLLPWREPMTRTVTVSTGKTTVVNAMYHGGYVVAWGRPIDSLPSPNSEFVAVSCGNGHAIGLKSDGTIVGWGDNSYGQISVPNPNSGFVSINAGRLHSVAVRSNGSIAAWGLNSQGQCNVPYPNSDFVMAAGGAFHSVGKKSTGNMWAWGYNGSGQCNTMSGNMGVSSIACANEVTTFLRYDGTLWATGDNYEGHLNLPSPNSGFVAVAMSDMHSLAVKSDGSVVGWGNNDYGQLNLPSSNSGFVAVSTGRMHSIGLKSDGSIAAWGYNNYGQLNIPSPNSGYVAIHTGTSFAYNVAIKLNDYGLLRVTTTPADGKWRRVGTSQWYGSGETEYDITPGNYTVEFVDLAGWTKPSPITVTTTTQLTQLTAAYTSPVAITLPQAKNCTDGTAVRISGLTVSAAWPDVFYTETDNRISGIRVEKPSHGLVYGNVADVVGIISTNADGERFIQASTAIKTGDGSVKPLGITNKQIGGSALPWQLGVLNGSGLNNIGLLVRSWGKVVQIEQVTDPALPTWFKIDDGSGAQTKCIVPSGVTINSVWNYMSVTGISSCEKVSNDIIRIIRIRTQDDMSSN